ncbi:MULTISPECIES: MEKHLA domain-containing protein [unclassified Nostoc]|uniref:MEKHLA domain-containing protein n=1 Tax=unclassified Nostoc TaxID=2593658 RepID=UPI002AD2A3CC|nr:MEKHLA domain-containing protein [Nostoc sp. DedQUE03]MDZ7976826.1 MEKHLA domain-containing protein [Nostoc sp. DedQUE03]MDZ8043148.1 MEKHLA domain-containing protein [Nostoc sp. DedQUE02]
MTSVIEFPWQQATIILHSQYLINSFQHWTGNSLLDANGSPLETAQMLFEAPFALVSHGTESDPIFNYGNRKALELWELSWEEFTKMPSRKSAEEVVQEERDRLLSEAATKGFITNYSGIRTSSTGKRFCIEDTILWNILDEQNQHCGQAAFFSNWKFVA